MLSHEYILLDGFQRASIGRYLTIASSLLSAAFVYLILRMYDLANEFGLNVNLTPSVMSLVGAGVVYAGLYFFFDRYLWRIRRVRNVLRVPNLSGTWRCTGISLNDESGARTEKEWAGTVTIAQSWDRLRIRLRTETSASSSVLAAFQHDEAGGFRLFYNYKNDPGVEHLKDLHPHSGFCEMVVAEDQQSAKGEYFNGRGRNTYGVMTWNRI